MNFICKIKSKICPVTGYLILHCILYLLSIHGFKYFNIYAKNTAHLKKKLVLG